MLPQYIDTPFAIMIPGQLAISKFQSLNSSQYMITIANPGIVTSIAFFLTQPIQPELATCLYAVYDQNQPWEFLGAIGNSRPSDIFPTNFSLNPNINKANQIALIVQFQPIDQTLQALVEQSSTKQNEYIMKIAIHLDNYLQTQPKQQLSEQQIAIPTKSVDQWIKRFEELYKIDRNFLYQ